MPLTRILVGNQVIQPCRADHRRRGTDMHIPGPAIRQDGGSPRVILLDCWLDALNAFHRYPAGIHRSPEEMVVRETQGSMQLPLITPVHSTPVCRFKPISRTSHDFILRRFQRPILVRACLLFKIVVSIAFRFIFGKIHTIVMIVNQREICTSTDWNLVPAGPNAYSSVNSALLARLVPDPMPERSEAEQ